MSRLKRVVRLLVVAVSVALAASACGGSSDSSGPFCEIFISGSSTVEPISLRVQELFNDIHPDVLIAVDGPGTGDGFVLFCSGETEISNASRAIRDSEAAQCAANGVNYVELQVGIDGLGVMTNAANDLVECVSFADLYALTGPEATGSGSWADVNAVSRRTRRCRKSPRRAARHFRPRRRVWDLRYVR